MLSSVAGVIVVALLGLAAHHADAAACYRAFKQADYPSCLQLDPSFVVHWRVDNTTKKEPSITFATDGDGYM